MRTLLALATLAMFHPTSDACGWVPPRVDLHKVTMHGTRSFAVLGAAPKVDDSDWQQVPPLTYDNTSFAELAPQKHVLTLVGDHGVRVVTVAHQVALRGGWQLGDGTPKAALEIPTGFQLALEGRVDDATWHPLVYRYSATQKLLAFDVRYGKDSYEILSDGKVMTSGQGTVLGMLDTKAERFLVVEATPGAPQAIYFGRPSA